MKVAMCKMLSLLLIPAAVAVQAGEWELLSSFYRPLRDTKVKDWGKDWGIKNPDGKLLIPWTDVQWMENNCTTFELYFIYHGKKPATIKNIRMDGKNIADCYRTAGNVVWHRIAPETVSPGEVFSLIVKLWYTPEKTVEFKFETADNRTFVHVVDFKKLACDKLIRRMILSRDMKTVHLWVEGREKITRVMLDGVDYTSRAKIGSFYGGTIPVSVSFDQKLVKGSFHNVYIGREKGSSAVTFRAFSNIFHTGIYNGPIKGGMEYHNFDDFWNLHATAVDTIKKMGEENVSAVVSIPQEKLPEYRNLNTITANYLPDEPDATEASKFKEIRWMGQRLGMLASYVNRCAENIIRELSHVPNMLVLDKTNRPANFFAYGRMADFTAVDYYCISSDLQPITCYPTARVSRIAAEPLPSWMVLGCVSRPTTSKWKRFPNNHEMHLMAWSSIAGGATSIGYWMYVDGTLTKGPASNPQLWNYMGKLNGEMKMIGHLLEISNPADGSVIKVPETVIGSVLRTAGDEATIVILLNKNSRSDQKGLTIPDLPPFEARIKLPAGVRSAEIGRLSVDGMSEIKFTDNGGEVKFQVSDLGECAAFVIFHSREAAEKVKTVFREIIEPRNRVADMMLRGKREAPDADFAALAVSLPYAEKIAPVALAGAEKVDFSQSALDSLQGQSFMRGGGTMSLTWELPAVAGEVILQYSTGEFAELIVEKSGKKEKMLLQPSVRRIAQWKHDGHKGRLTLAVKNGVASENILFIKQTDISKQDFKRTLLKCSIAGDDPFSKEKAETLSDGDLLKGPRWSNSKNRLATKKIEVTAELQKPESLRHLIVCGHYNRWYALRELQATVWFTDGSCVELPPRQGFRGGIGSGYRKYILFWELPDKPVQRIVLNPVPENHFWLFLGEVIGISS